MKSDLAWVEGIRLLPALQGQSATWTMTHACRFAESRSGRVVCPLWEVSSVTHDRRPVWLGAQGLDGGPVPSPVPHAFTFLGNNETFSRRGVWVSDLWQGSVFRERLFNLTDVHEPRPLIDAKTLWNRLFQYATLQSCPLSTQSNENSSSLLEDWGPVNGL